MSAGPVVEPVVGPMVGPVVRPRRLRRTPALRELVAETSLAAHHLVLPVFVREGAAEPVPVTSMPGVVQHTRDSVRRAAAEAAGLGLGGIMFFGVPEHKDAVGTGATDPEGGEIGQGGGPGDEHASTLTAVPGYPAER